MMMATTGRIDLSPGHEENKHPPPPPPCGSHHTYCAYKWRVSAASPAVLFGAAVLGSAWHVTCVVGVALPPPSLRVTPRWPHRGPHVAVAAPTAAPPVLCGNTTRDAGRGPITLRVVGAQRCWSCQAQPWVAPAVPMARAPGHRPPPAASTSPLWSPVGTAVGPPPASSAPLPRHQPT